VGHTLQWWENTPVPMVNNAKREIIMSTTHLHETFRIISNPLFISLVYVEMVKPWERRSHSNPENELVLCRNE
jgi:hypothetical protein